MRSGLWRFAPTSVEAAKSNGVSAEAAGLKTGYIDAHFPFGSTNVQPTAIAMKNAGVDAITPEVDPNTSFALINALRTLGATPKVALLPIGYGADLLYATSPDFAQVPRVSLNEWADASFTDAALRTVGVDTSMDAPGRTP